MLILNVIDNGLACDCGVSRVLIMTLSPILPGIFYIKMGCTNLVYEFYIWYIAFITVSIHCAPEIE